MEASNFLHKIVEYKKKVNEDSKVYYQTVKAQLDKSEYTRYSLFKNQISKENQICLIAEIKKASPSKGIIREDFDVKSLARIYSESGASAISVLTEDKYFLGKPEFVKQVSDNFEVPVLTKDFIIHEGQIYQTRANGASAVLLIMAILTDEQVKSFIATAARLDLDCLVEVHDEEELDRALGCKAEIIGVNNRNLKTFEVNMKTCEDLIPKIPSDIVIVAESGISSHDDLVKLQKIGANAVLVGETFMREADVGAKVKELLNG